MVSAIPIPIIPSVSYSIKVLCLTEDLHWFWFDASIQRMKHTRTSITPVNNREAFIALKDSPEILDRYFSDRPKSSV